MNTQKFKILLIIAIPLFTAHALEEYFSSFYLVDPSFAWMGNIINLNLKLAFLIVAIMGFLLLGISIHKPNKIMLTIAGLIFILEISHPILAITSGIYAGLLTSIPLILLGVFYWRTLLKSRVN